MSYLRLFCTQNEKEDGQRGFREPMRFGDWTYATDGMIIIRVPAKESDMEDGRSKYVINAIFDNFPDDVPRRAGACDGDAGVAPDYFLDSPG